MSDDMLIINIETIDELDDYLHQKVMNTMKNGVDGRVVKLVLSEKLNKLGTENITQMLMMKSVERALNDPEINNRDITYSDLTDLSNRSDVLDSDEVNPTFENTVLPILIGSKNVTYH